MVVEAAQRRDRFGLNSSLVVVALFLGGILIVCRNEQLVLTQWKQKFDKCHLARAEALAWFRKLPANLERYAHPEPPANVKALATGAGRVLVTTDKAGRRWLGIAIVSYGIDNDKVFLWSESGDRPPEEAYPVVVKSWPMGDGWWFASTT
jgi:hypothetical protein